MKYLIGEEEVKNILDHWNSTPANSYRGSSYGESHNRVLFQSMSAEVADQIIADIKQDIPLFANLDSDSLTVLSEDLGNDKKQIYISIGQVMIPIATADTSNYTGDTFNAYAK